MPEEKHACVFCQKTSQEIPLLALEYKDQRYWICPTHFPILIHRPNELVGKLPGAEKLRPHEH